MSNDRPLVSIGMPVFNGEDFLEAALESLLNQTFTDFEIILSDNASSDRTATICQAYAARDSRIRYYRNPHNIGAAENYNQAFRLSRGTYFKWAAHDDLCAPTFLERCVDILDHDPSVVLSFSDVGRIDWAGNEQPPKRDRPRRLDSWETPARFASIVLQTFWCYEIFGLIRADSLRNVQLQRGNYGTDRVVLAELSLQGRFIQVPETLFFRRFHLKQSTCLASAKARQQWQNGDRKRNPFWERSSVGFVQGILQAPITIPERLQCFGVVFQYLTCSKNWLYFLPKALRQQLAQRKPQPYRDPAELRKANRISTHAADS
ncbi:glycosyltransferase family 2 protein [Myxacorys almedinensis]|uniref:Glycosyltransferase n=1 Tax=Myxacorys almedinensis A TaxID=2690445 RepID=A0A8J7Z479_9CYAN|nr:glycosyltransferase family 2 protein [Myxacorys almedinensis]NDJ19694.1 glycosyltransferase [Myxacorys almedinensis A]